MKKVLKILGLAFIFALFSNFNTSVSASSEENLGVSIEPPILEEEVGDIIPFGVDRPFRSNVVDLNSKALTFKGKAQNSTLYTNYHFKGKTTPSYEIKNHSSSALTVRVYEKGTFSDTLVRTINLPRYSNGGGTIFNLNSSKLYYLSFSAPSNFEGSVY